MRPIELPPPRPALPADMEKKGLRDQLEAQAREIARLQGEPARWLNWLLRWWRPPSATHGARPGRAGPRQSVILCNCSGRGMQCCRCWQRQEQCRALRCAIVPNGLLSTVCAASQCGRYVGHEHHIPAQRSSKAAPLFLPAPEAGRAARVVTAAFWPPPAAVRRHFIAAAIASTATDLPAANIAPPRRHACALPQLGGAAAGAIPAVQPRCCPPRQARLVSAMAAQVVGCPACRTLWHGRHGAMPPAAAAAAAAASCPADEAWGALRSAYRSCHENPTCCPICP